MNRSFLHTRSVRCKHLSVFRYRLTKNGFAVSGAIEKQAPQALTGQPPPHASCPIIQQLQDMVIFDSDQWRTTIAPVVINHYSFVVNRARVLIEIIFSC